MWSSLLGNLSQSLVPRDLRRPHPPAARDPPRPHAAQNEIPPGKEMPIHAPPSPQMHPAKRLRQSPPDKDSPPSLNSASAAGPSPATSDQQDGGLPSAGLTGSGGASSRSEGVAGGGAKVGQSSNFRNVSACNRCRLRKNRCDQKLPSCQSCEKANVACVGYDPITKKEIPRRLVMLLLFAFLIPALCFTATDTDLVLATSFTSRRGSNSSRHCCAHMIFSFLPPIT